MGATFLSTRKYCNLIVREQHFPPRGTPAWGNAFAASSTTGSYRFFVQSLPLWCKLQKRNAIPSAFIIRHAKELSVSLVLWKAETSYLQIRLLVIKQLQGTLLHAKKELCSFPNNTCGFCIDVPGIFQSTSCKASEPNCLCLHQHFSFLIQKCPCGQDFSGKPAITTQYTGLISKYWLVYFPF